MSPRARAYAVMAAVLLSVPGVAGAAATNTITVATSAPAESTIDVRCDYECSGFMGCFGDVTVDRFVFTATSGTFPGGASTETVVLPAPVNPATHTLSWKAPSTAGTAATLTCQGGKFDPGTGTVGLKGTAATADVSVAAPTATNPLIGIFTTPTGTVFVSSEWDVTSLAFDPNGKALTYAWTATGGTFADPSSPSTRWTAPATQPAGPVTLTVKVTNSDGYWSEKSAVVTVAVSVYQAGLPAELQYPRRVAATAGGDLLVVDDTGGIFLLTKLGASRGSIPALGATAVTVGVLDGRETAFVSTSGKGILQFDPYTGRKLGALPWRFSSTVTGLALDGTRRLLWAAVAGGVPRAVALTMTGDLAAEITAVEGRAIRDVAGVALDAASDTLWVAEQSGATGSRVHAFRAADATYLRSMLSEVKSTGGITLGADGRIFVSDVDRGTIYVRTSAGAVVGTIGSMGNVDGYLLHPRGLAFMANGDLAVANSWFNRIDRFGTGAPLPTCAGDADCDGIPDGFDLLPNDPSNALADSDGDGLNDAEEYAFRTDPAKGDTDGDGYGDHEEVLAGFDPLDGGDHRPQCVVGGPIEAGPGLVTLSATGTGAGTCVAAWRQLSGAAVMLRDATTFTPSFIARKAGTYRFEGVAMCGTASSTPAVAEVKVLDVAPIAEAGGDVVIAPGRTVTLSGSFSSDANGDALTYSWEQVAGPATSLVARGASLTVRPSAAGYYAFQLTATDPAGHAATDTLSVVVVNDALPTAIVAQPVVNAIVGSPVTLDASASLPQGVTFSWVQIGGAVELPAVAQPSFTPTAPGAWVFEVTAWNGALRSPPARVLVLATAATPPVAVATAPSTGAVNVPLTLDGAASTGSSLTYRWRQVAGPAAGISGADGATPTVVPFVTGAYAFELTVTDADGAVSAPAAVRFSVTAPGKVLPVASVTAPADAVVGQLVVLDGRASSGATRFRWTQVGGPWVALNGASAVAVFQPPAAGTYELELVVDDGVVRSAPATVTVNVQ